MAAWLRVWGSKMLWLWVESRICRTLGYRLWTILQVSSHKLMTLVKLPSCSFWLVHLLSAQSNFGKCNGSWSQGAAAPEACHIPNAAEGGGWDSSDPEIRVNHGRTSVPLSCTARYDSCSHLRILPAPQDDKEVCKQKAPTTQGFVHATFGFAHAIFQPSALSASHRRFRLLLISKVTPAII